MFKIIKSAIALIVISGICAVPTGLKATELFFSEYIEGTSYNKALEIFNPTVTPINLLLDDYSVHFYHNGKTTESYVLQLSGILFPDNTYVIASPNADQQITDMADRAVSVYFCPAHNRTGHGSNKLPWPVLNWLPGFSWPRQPF